MASHEVKKTGLSFSGGGVRSMSFCSGVLRRLLQKGVSIDYMSTVSGGGYLGSSYMDWKFRNGGKDDPTWHKEFFENLRKFSNPLCDCFFPARGILDGLVFFLVILLLSIGISSLAAFSFVMPTSVIINYVFGDTLRGLFNCRLANNTDAEELNLERKSSPFRLCRPRFGPKMMNMMSTILPLFAVFMLCYYISGLVKNRTIKYLMKFIARLSGLIFFMVFLPWFIEMFRHFTPRWASSSLIVLVLIVLVFAPSLRSKATVTLFILMYAYAVVWTVFKTPVADVPYSDDLYYILLWVAAGLLWIQPYLAALQLFGINRYNEWRLARAFYSPQSKKLSCALACRNSTAEEKPLTLADLADIKPHYKCNVTVNRWRKNDTESANDYEVLTFSPDGIERLDRSKDDTEFNREGFIGPKDIRLSSAMATSASAVTYDLGRYEEYIDDSTRDIQAFLGVSLGKHQVSQTGLNWMSLVVTFVIQLLFGVTVLTIPGLLYFKVLHDREYWMVVTMILFGIFFGSLSLIAIMPSGDPSKGRWSKFIRWCIIKIIHVRVLRNLFDITDTGPTPPPVMSLSDGGHTENLGILPLFKLRLPRIIAVNGGSDTDYAMVLLYALKQAREKLHCSFTGITGRDIIEDIRDNFVEKEQGEQPRSYRFKVQYYEKDVHETKLVGEGEVILLMPRHPNDGLRPYEDKTTKNLNDHDMEEGEVLPLTPKHNNDGSQLYQGRKWKDFDDGDVKLDLDESVWGPGPACGASEVDRLSGCCWEWCHNKRYKLLNPLTGVFPLHSTANQMFTTSQHVAYHREGYYACVEAEADTFFTDIEEKGSTVVVQPTVIDTAEL